MLAALLLKIRRRRAFRTFIVLTAIEIFGRRALAVKTLGRRRKSLPAFHALLAVKIFTAVFKTLIHGAALSFRAAKAALFHSLRTVARTTLGSAKTTLAHATARSTHHLTAAWTALRAAKTTLAHAAAGPAHHLTAARTTLRSAGSALLSAAGVSALWATAARITLLSAASGRRPAAGRTCVRSRYAVSNQAEHE